MKEQINVRLSPEGRELLNRLVEHFSARQADTGRKATQTEVMERAIRALAAGEKISKKSAVRA